jgi:carbamoyl-phosphate synthase large subunit
MSDHGAVTVIVTGVGGGGIGEQIIKALRLAEIRYQIIGTDISSLSRGLAVVDHPYVVPPAMDARYLSAIRSIAARHGARAVFAGSEPELRVLARHRGRLEADGIFVPANPVDVIDTCLDKNRTMQFLIAHGFRAPRTVRIDDERHLSSVDFFPAVLKPSVGGGGSADVTIVQDQNELLAFGRYLLASSRAVIAQEYIGTPDSEFTVGVLMSMNGELINSIAVRRFTTSALGNRVKVPNRSGREELGDLLVVSSGISQGQIGTFPEVTQPCERIASALGARGPLNIQCRHADGQVVVFEINPRFSGTTSLRAMVGFNEPDLLVREHVLGERVRRRFAYREGIILRGLEETLLPTQDVPVAIDLA